MTREEEDRIVAQAFDILRGRTKEAGDNLPANPSLYKKLLCTRLGGSEREEFAVLFLDSQGRLITLDVMFQGSMSECSLYPREIARAALLHNATDVILAHNHPSGAREFSPNDKDVTKEIQRTLEAVDVRLVDHVLVLRSFALSMRDKGLL